MPKEAFRNIKFNAFQSKKFFLTGYFGRHDDTLRWNDDLTFSSGKRGGGLQPHPRLGKRNSSLSGQFCLSHITVKFIFITFETLGRPYFLSVHISFFKYLPAPRIKLKINILICSSTRYLKLCQVHQTCLQYKEKKQYKQNGTDLTFLGVFLRF